jgi:mannosylfructose-phosphate synthase
MTRRDLLVVSIHGYVGANPELGKPDTGGQVVFVLELAKQFAELGYRVDVVTRRFEGQPEFDRLSENLRIWRVAFGGKEFIRKEDMHDHLDEFVRRFLAERRRPYVAVLSHYWDGGWAGQRIAEELRLPHIHTPHSLGAWKRRGMGGDPDEAERTFRFEERIRKEFLVYRRCDHLIATTHQQVELLLSEDYDVPKWQISMIPPGIDERLYTPVPQKTTSALRRRLGFGPHDIYAVGRAATNKGYDLLIRALPYLREAVRDARLQLAVGAGAGRDKRLIERLAGLAVELNVDEHVRWLGHIPDPAMADHYRAAAVFALSSRYEPFGMTAVEAMACGTPTVMTVHGGLHDMIDFGVHGLYADPKRPAEFAAVLGLPLRYERLRQVLAVEGARLARREFGWGGVAKRTVAVIERVRDQYENRGPHPSGPNPISSDEKDLGE